MAGANKWPSMWCTPDERPVAGIRERFGVDDADEQSASQSGSGSQRATASIADAGRAGLRQRAVHHGPAAW